MENIKNVNLDDTKNADGKNKPDSHINNSQIEDLKIDNSMDRSKDNLMDNPMDNLVDNQTDDGVTLLTSKQVIKEGFNFHFEVDDYKIHAWGSSKSGKEVVTVDGEIVSEKRSLGRHTIHSFILNNVRYEIEFNVKSLLTGEFHCSLIKDGAHIETQKQVPKNSATKKMAKKNILIAFILGGICGYVAMTLMLEFFVN